MGRTPLLDQERGGESIFRNLISSQNQIGQQARTNTFDQLRGAQNALSGVYNTQDQLSKGGFENDLMKSGASYKVMVLLCPLS